MTDDQIKRRILRFLKLMQTDHDDETLMEEAIERAWLTVEGSPTPQGVRLAQSFDDLERVSGVK